jgi:hypothetical protein
MELVILISIVSVFIISLFLPINPIAWVLKPWLNKSLSVVDGLARSAVIVLLISLFGRLLGKHPVMFIINELTSTIFPSVL